jgi:hypothetical protein
LSVPEPIVIDPVELGADGIPPESVTVPPVVLSKPVTVVVPVIWIEPLVVVESVPPIDALPVTANAAAPVDTVPAALEKLPLTLSALPAIEMFAAVSVPTLSGFPSVSVAV